MMMVQHWTGFGQRFIGTVPERNETVKERVRFWPEATERLKERFRF